MEEKHYHTMTAAETGRHSFGAEDYTPGWHHCYSSVTKLPDSAYYVTKEGKVMRFIREDNHENH